MKCPTCLSLDIDLVEWRPDTTRELLCLRCTTQWVHGTPRAQRATKADRAAALKDRFPSADSVLAARREAVEGMKQRFLAAHPDTDQDVQDYWRTYQEVFSRHGLWTCDPQRLKDFANIPTGADPGIQAGFNIEWNALGEADAARRTRESLAYLLHDEGPTSLEDRLSALIRGHDGFGMKGFREALLTKALAVVEPDRWIAILKYTGSAGKREIAESVYGLRLPEPESVNWTIGRLITWSNDLLLELLGDGFVDGPHRAKFLWGAKDGRW